MFKQTQRERFSVTRLETEAEVSARAGTDNYRWPRSVPDGEMDAVIEVQIDVAAIVRVMGAKAVRSKSRKCVDGFVTVRAHSLQKVLS